MLASLSWAGIGVAGACLGVLSDIESEYGKRQGQRYPFPKYEDIYM